MRQSLEQDSWQVLENGISKLLIWDWIIWVLRQMVLNLLCGVNPVNFDKAFDRVDMDIT